MTDINPLFDFAKGLVQPIADLLSEAIPNTDERYRIATELSTLSVRQGHEIALKQIEVNKIESASEKWWKAGWRPFIGWVCGVALFFHYIVFPIIGIWFTMPALDMAGLMPLLFGLLGLGGYRTIEKTRMMNK
jgi:hypothetical protein